VICKQVDAAMSEQQVSDEGVMGGLRVADGVSVIAELLART
jgi:hypothetical protein